MSTIGLVQLLYAALAVVMAGLGLSLRLSDFAGLRRHGRAAVFALVLQMIVLPGLAPALVLLFGMTGNLAMGMTLLAATPGSITANLHSHLFGGRVAFCVALTGVNTFLCALTLPVLGSWAITHFVGAGQVLPVLLDKATQTIDRRAGTGADRHGGGGESATRGCACRQDGENAQRGAGRDLQRCRHRQGVKEWDALMNGFAQGRVTDSFRLIAVIQ